MNRGRFVTGNGPLLVNGLTQNVKNAAQGSATNRHTNRGSRINNFHASNYAVGAAHGHRAHSVVAQQLLPKIGGGISSKEIAVFTRQFSVMIDAGLPLEISPLMIEIFKDGQKRYGARAQSDDIIRRLEEASGLDIRAPGFPAELIDDEPEERGAEVVPARG